MSYLFAGLTEQRKAAIRREGDAEIVRRGGRWRGAMYVLGYSVECRLKARLMERFGVYHLRDLQVELERRLRRKINLRTHSLDVLLEYTQAEHRLQGSVQRAYNRCRTWTVEWRYDPNAGSRVECEEFFEGCKTFRSFVTRSL